MYSAFFQNSITELQIQKGKKHSRSEKERNILKKHPRLSDSTCQIKFFDKIKNEGRLLAFTAFQWPDKGVQPNKHTLITISEKARYFSISPRKEKDNLRIKDCFPQSKDIWLLCTDRLSSHCSLGGWRWKSCLGFGDLHPVTTAAESSLTLTRQTKQHWFAHFIGIYGSISPCKVIIWWKGN